MSDHKGSAHHFCLRVALLICKVHGGACRNCTSTRKKKVLWEMKNYLLGCSHDTVMTWINDISCLCAVLSTSLYLYLFLYYRFTFLSDRVSLPRRSIRSHFLAGETHSSYQIIIQTEAQINIWWIALHCERYTLSVASVVTFFSPSHYNWWSGSNRKLIKSI